MKALSEIVDKLLNINPISAISIVFTFLMMWLCKYCMRMQKESNEKAIKEIKASYSEASKMFKSIANKYMKETKDKIKTKNK